jgi:glyoxylase-like metal-dependent hydrolase (beta-lactamase superfamily II)
MLGHPALPVYLLDGEQPVIFDAGFSFAGELYTVAIEAVLGRRAPAYCLLTHSHFDHCGAAAALKDRYPEMKILASEKARQTLKRPNAIDLIRNLNQAAESYARSMGLVIQDPHPFRPFEVDGVLKEGNVIEVARGLVVETIETPGHTWDCMSYYIPSLRALISSEAAGQADSTGYIVSDCLADYDQYVASLQKLNRLTVDVLCLGHLYAYTGTDAKAYIPRSLHMCAAFRRLVEESLARTQGDIAQVMAHVRSIEYDGNPGPKQTEEAYMINLEARVKAVAKRMQLQ